jgi:hypothetical protein
MNQEPKAGRVTASFEQIAYSNMLVVEALVELLVEKGALTNQELLDRIQKLKHQTRVNLAAQGNEGMAAPGERVALVAVEDLVSANMIAVEALLALLVDKAFLTEAEMEELLGDLKRKASKTLLRKQ